MKIITYEIEKWIEIHFQGARFRHGDRWYILNSLTSDPPHPCYYLSEAGSWQTSDPKFFDTPEEAEQFWKASGARK